MSEKAKAMREALDNAKPKPAEIPSTYPYFDENERNGYALAIIKTVLAEKIMTSPDFVIAHIAGMMFDAEPRVGKFIDDDGAAITFPKDNDPIRDFLAQKMIGKIWNGEDL